MGPKPSKIASKYPASASAFLLALPDSDCISIYMQHRGRNLCVPLVTDRSMPATEYPSCSISSGRKTSPYLQTWRCKRENVVQDLSSSGADDLAQGLKVLQQHATSLQNEIGHCDRVLSILHQLANQQASPNNLTSLNPPVTVHGKLLAACLSLSFYFSVAQTLKIRRIRACPCFMLNHFTYHALVWFDWCIGQKPKMWSSGGGKGGSREAARRLPTNDTTASAPAEGPSRRRHSHDLRCAAQC